MSEVGSRFNSGKPQLGLILRLPFALTQFTGALQLGVAKYGRDNYHRGLNFEELQDSLLRHATAIANGEVIDEESGLPHTALLMANSAFMAELTCRGTAYSSYGPEYLERFKFTMSELSEQISNIPSKLLEAEKKKAKTNAKPNRRSR